jgi:hypothetical protein
MHLILIGSEYSGTTTIALAISNWAESVMGGHHGFHDHWKIPHLSHPKFGSPEASEKGWADWAAGRIEDPTRTGYTDEEQDLLLALTPNQKEGFQRYHIDYHISPDFYSYPDHNVAGMHYDEAVYAGLYYGYGGDGEYADRKKMVHHVDERILGMAPDSVLILLKCSPEAIRGRMKENPHKNAVLQEKDVELVLSRFEEEYEKSIIKHKFTIDTSTATVDECLAEFVEKFEEFITESDRTRILVHRAKQEGKWL